MLYPTSGPWMSDGQFTSESEVEFLIDKGLVRQIQVWWNWVELIFKAFKIAHRNPKLPKAAEARSRAHEAMSDVVWMFKIYKADPGILQSSLLTTSSLKLQTLNFK